MNNMDEFRKIKYLLKEKREASVASIVNVLKLEDTELIVCSIEDELLFFTCTHNQSIESQCLRTKDTKELRRIFKRRNLKEIPETHWFMEFRAVIVDVCFNIELDIFCILTKNGEVWSFSISALFKRCFNPSNEAESDIFSDLLSTKQKSQSALNISDLKFICITIQGGLMMSTTETDLFILAISKNKLCLIISHIEQQSKLTHVSTQKLLSTIPDETSMLYILSHNQTKPSFINIDKKLYSNLFLGQSTLTSYVCLFSTKESVFYTSVTPSQCISDVRILCELKQPLKFLSSMTIRDISNEDTLTTCNEQFIKLKIDDAVKLFCENAADNNCLLLVGSYGKVVVIFNDGERDIYSENQLPSPVKTIVTKENVLIVSDSKNVYTIKISIKAHSILWKRETKVRLSANLVFLRSTPLTDIEAMCITHVEPLDLCCVNIDRKIMAVAFREGTVKVQPPNKKGLNLLIEQLEDVNAELTLMKTKSSTMNNILSEIRIATYICYALQRQVRCHEKDFFDVKTSLNRIVCSSETKMLVMCEFVNNSRYTFSASGWSLSIKYCPKYQDTDCNGMYFTKCVTESFPLSCVQPNNKLAFNFIIDSHWFKYSPIMLAFYMNFSFENITKSINTSKKLHGVSLYLKTRKITINDMCAVSHTPNVSSFFSTNSDAKVSTSRDVLFHQQMKYARGEQLLKQESFQLHVYLSLNTLEYLQLKQPTESPTSFFNQFFHSGFNASSGATSSCIILTHINGECAEVILKKGDVINNYVLILMSKNLPFLAALHHDILLALQNSPSHTNSFNDCENDPQRLKTSSDRCKIIQDEISKTDPSSRKQESLLSELMKIYLELSKSIYAEVEHSNESELGGKNIKNPYSFLQAQSKVLKQIFSL